MKNTGGVNRVGNVGSERLIIDRVYIDTKNPSFEGVSLNDDTIRDASNDLLEVTVGLSLIHI